MIFVELNDWQFTARNEDGSVLFQECASASTANGALEFGKAALDVSRSHPQRFNNKYLYALAADPIAGDLKPAKNHADLIYHHLKQKNFDSDQVLTFCISGQVTNQQLGLLLGICQEANLNVQGFIEAALGQSLTAPVTRDYHVLDIELHRMTLSQIKVDGKIREQGQTTAIDGLGVANIIEGWMNVIADEFVQKTRFDPLHAGDSEQQLFNQVIDWIEQSSLTDQRVSMVNGNANRDIEISQSLLLEKLRQRVANADLHDVDTLVLTPRAANVPGLESLLADRIANVITLNEADIVGNYAALAAQLDPTEIRRISQAESSVGSAVGSSPDATPATHSEPPSADQATHLLADHIAYPLDRATFSHLIDSTSATTRSAEVSINGQREPGLVIHAGDNVEANDTSYVAIRIE